MKKNLFKFSLIAVFIFGLGIFTFQSKAADDIIMSMSGKDVTLNESYQQARIDTKAEGFFDIINSEILSKDYSYEKNKKVKDEVDNQIKSIEDNNPDTAKEYGAKDTLDLLKKSGQLLAIQEEQYTKAQYEKEFITEKSLKKLYDNREGELTSYFVVKVDETTFEGDTEKVAAAKKDIEAQLAKATKDNVKSVFEDLAKKYPGADEDKNEEKKQVDRSQVDEKVLKALDGYKYLEFSKKPIEVEGVYYYILKTDKGERASFAASKEKLKDLQYEKATEENSYLTEYLLVKLREKNDVKFTNETDKKVYEAATKQIIDDYNDAKDGDK